MLGSILILFGSSYGREAGIFDFIYGSKWVLHSLGQIDNHGISGFYFYHMEGNEILFRKYESGV